MFKNQSAYIHGKPRSNSSKTANDEVSRGKGKSPNIIRQRYVYIISIYSVFSYPQGNVLKCKNDISYTMMTFLRILCHIKYLQGELT